MSKKKEYTSSFKRHVIEEVLSGKITKEGAKLRYEIGGNTTILDWMRVYAGYKTKQTGTDPLPNLQAMQTDDEKARLEDEVILLGRDGKAGMSIDEMAALADTINYEIPTRIRESIPRVIV